MRLAITALGVESSVAPIPDTFVIGASVLIGTKGGGIEGKALPPPVPEFDPDPEPVPPGQTPHTAGIDLGLRKHRDRHAENSRQFQLPIERRSYIRNGTDCFHLIRVA